jgi:hypothetical protein
VQNARYLAGIVLLYGIACALLAFVLPEDEVVPGIQCLIQFPWVLFYASWWATPLFFGGCVALAGGRGRLAAGLGLAAVPLDRLRDLDGEPRRLDDRRAAGRAAWTGQTG